MTELLFRSVKPAETPVLMVHGTVTCEEKVIVVTGAAGADVAAREVATVELAEGVVTFVEMAIKEVTIVVLLIVISSVL